MIEGLLLVCLGFFLGWSVGRWQLTIWFQREIGKVRADFDNWTSMSDEELSAVFKPLDDLLSRLRSGEAIEK